MNASAALAANLPLAAKLDEVADLLEQQEADGFRVAAYRKAAAAVRDLDRPVAAILTEGGRDALVTLPAIGRRIAAALAEMVATGRWSQLDRLRGSLDPERLFRPQVNLVEEVVPSRAARLEEDLPAAGAGQPELARRELSERRVWTPAQAGVAATKHDVHDRHLHGEVRLELVAP